MSFSFLVQARRLQRRIAASVVGTIAAIAATCAVVASAQTISTVPLPANRDVASSRSTSATLFNGEPLVAYKRCATTGCGNAQEIAITYCISNCGGAHPVWRDWVIANAPSNIFGDYVAVAIARDGKPMVAWVDISFTAPSPSTIMVARCIADCDSERPRYVRHAVATHAPDVVDRIAIVDTGSATAEQAVAYIQTPSGQRLLKMAVCTANCSTATPTYNVATIDNQLGRTSPNRISMTAYDGKPIVAYTDFGDSVQRSELRVARCTSACESAAPVYNISPVFGVTSPGQMMLFPAIAVNATGDHHVTYQVSERNAAGTAFTVGTRVARCTSGCTTATPVYSNAVLVETTHAASRYVAANSFPGFGGEYLAVFHAGHDNTNLLRRIDYNPGAPIPAATTVDTLPGGTEVGAIHALGRSAASLPAYVVYETRNASAVGFKLLSYAGVAGSDTTPDAFSFSDVTDVMPGTVITSDPVSISGIDAPAPISVSGGSYSVGCAGPYVTAASTIMSGDIVCVRHTASNTPVTAANTTLTIGGVSDVFTSTTQSRPVDTTPEPFSFADQFDVPVSSVRTSSPVSINGFDVPVAISVSNGSYSVGCTSTYISTASTISAGDVVCVRHTSAAAALTRVDTVVTIGGVSDTFSSTTAAAGGSDTTPDVFNIPLMSGLNMSTLQRSQTVTIIGINAPAPISVVDGEYSVGCTGSFTSAPGTISNFDDVCVRRTTAATPMTAVSVRLTVGGVSATWYAITAASAAPPVVIVPSPITYNAFVGVPFTSTAPAVTGGTAPYTFVATTLPVPGLALGNDGVLRGAPTYAASYSLDFYVIDAVGQTSNGRMTVNVAAAPVAEAIAVPTTNVTSLLLMAVLIATLAGWRQRSASIADQER